MAFQAINKNFQEQLQQTPEDQKVLIVVVKEASNLPYTDALSATTDPFCRVNVVEPVQDFGQLQRTSREYQDYTHSFLCIYMYNIICRTELQLLDVFFCLWLTD